MRSSRLRWSSARPFSNAEFCRLISRSLQHQDEANDEHEQQAEQEGEPVAERALLEEELISLLLHEGFAGSGFFTQHGEVVLQAADKELGLDSVAGAVVEIAAGCNGFAVLLLKLMQRLRLAGAAVSGVGFVGEEVIDVLPFLTGVEGFVLGEAVGAGIRGWDCRVGGVRSAAVAVADELEHGIGFIHPSAQDTEEVACIRGGEVLINDIVAEGTECPCDECARAPQLCADSGDENDGPHAHAVRRVACGSVGARGEMVQRRSLPGL